jgi:hypothetical protein
MGRFSSAPSAAESPDSHILEDEDRATYDCFLSDKYRLYLDKVAS